MFRDSKFSKGPVALHHLLISALGLLVLTAVMGIAAENTGHGVAPSLTRPDSLEKAPNADGFIQRWVILEPIRANGLTDSAVQAAVKTEYFSNLPTIIPRDGEQVDIGGTNFTWHAVDTKEYNVNLYHFANALGKPTSYVLFWAVTIVNCPQEMVGVRLAIGSNAASVWWVNGQKVIGIYGDRQTVIDDGVSKRLTLKKGPNIVRCAVINGGGATDFCARFLDAKDQPLKGFTVSAGEVKPYQDTNFYVFLCFGQSNMEGYPGIDPQDTGPVDDRFQVLAAVDFPKLDRKKGNWYPAVPPLCRPSSGLCPADYFGRTMVSNLPPHIRIGVVNVSVAGCKIELFDKNNFQAYASTAPSWMTNIIKTYGGNPYTHLVEMGKLAQKNGVIKGILLHQGESNTNDKQWPNKVKSIYDNLITDLNLKAEEVPLLAGELVNADQKGACASMNASIDELPKTIPNSHVISSQGCASRPDRLHFNPEGYRDLGKRYAEKMLSLLGYKMADPK